MKAVDMTKMDQKAKQEAFKEAQMLYRLNHPNIIGYKDVFDVSDGNARMLYIVMTYADGLSVCLFVSLSPSLFLTLCAAVCWLRFR
jgi:serine/threonine protein kinase